MQQTSRGVFAKATMTQSCRQVFAYWVQEFERVEAENKSMRASLADLGAAPQACMEKNSQPLSDVHLSDDLDCEFLQEGSLNPPPASVQLPMLPDNPVPALPNIPDEGHDVVTVAECFDGVDQSNGINSERKSFVSFRKESVTSHQPMFPNVEDMKELVKKQMEKHELAVNDPYKTEGLAQRIARNHWFENAVLLVIVLNALWIMVDTDYNDAATILAAEPIFIVAEQVFCLFFSGELFIRFGAYKIKREAFRNAWFVFDLCLVAMMIGEAWVTPAVMMVADVMSQRPGRRQAGNTSLLRVARVIKVLRMLRISRLMHACPEFFILMKAIASATRAVFFTLMFLIVVLYVFGITFTTLLKDRDLGQRKFKTVGLSMQTLFVQGALMDDLTTLMNDTMRESFACWLLLYILLVVASITIMNMLIGVLCEATTAVAETERNAMYVAHVQNTLAEVLFDDCDEDHDGKIKKSEFMRILESSRACKAIEEVGVDPVGLVAIADTIFCNDETGEYDKELDFGNFMEILLEFRSTNTATKKDALEIMRELQRTQKLLKVVACRVKPSRQSNEGDGFGPTSTMNSSTTMNSG
jgi:voltage-gated sodium channel